MDQNSSSGSGADKRNWRERLGIGGKDMPKISDEFKAAAPAPSLKVPQPVAKPAPMAPRATAGKYAAAPGSESLAEKLRSQRAAAEKLAEQRVSVARDQVEAKAAPEAAPVLEPSYQARPETRAEPARPKFTFADEESVAAKAESMPQRGLPPPQPKPRTISAPPIPPPLVPPRPALGGDRLPPPPRPSVPASQPQYRAQVPSGYRPADAAAPQLPPPYRAGVTPPRSYLPGSVPPGYGDPRYGGGRAGQEISWRGPPASAGQPDDRAELDPRLARGVPARPRAHVPADEYGDVFEDEAPRPRRRASASEYNSAYREVEEGYEDDRRRSSGPWLLLLALLIAAVATFGIIWYYQTNIRNVASTAPTPENVPVITAPEQPAKTAAEQPVDGAATGGAANKKQIYDRIVGDQEVTGEKIAPAEDTPVTPDLQPPAASGSEQDPLPATTAPDSESEPLALPPPPGEGDTQGAIPSASDQQTMAMKTTGTDVVAEPATAAESDAAAEALPPPKPAATEVEPAPIAPGEVIAEPEGQPATKKTAATDKKATVKEKTSGQAVTGAEPVILVPPAEYVPPASTTGAAPGTTVANTQPETKKKKTLFDLLQATSKSGSTEAAATQSGTAGADTAGSAPDQQVASLPEPAPQQKGATGATASGYVVQLASFRSEAEAQTEYTRLKAKYPGIIGGLPPRISQAAVLGSTRYRLGLGPMASRDSASKLCNSLVAAGERDCLVRKQ